jgi:hypothetical protein
MKKDWWAGDEEDEEQHAADMIFDRGVREWSEKGTNEFNEEYEGVPVRLIRGEWRVVDSAGEEAWDTGVMAEEVADNGEIGTVGQLADWADLEGLDGTPSNLAYMKGWPMHSWPLDLLAKKFPEVRNLLKEAEAEEKVARKELKEEMEFERLEAEAVRQEEREERMREMGIELRYAPKGMTREEASAFLDMPPDSQTVDLYVRGLLDEDEALRRAAKIRHRHEETSYEELLRRGFSKEDARAIIEGE